MGGRPQAGRREDLRPLPVPSAQPPWVLGVRTLQVPSCHPGSPGSSQQHEEAEAPLGHWEVQGRPPAGRPASLCTLAPPHLAPPQPASCCPAPTSSCALCTLGGRKEGPGPWPSPVPLPQFPHLPKGAGPSRCPVLSPGSREHGAQCWHTEYPQRRHEARNPDKEHPGQPRFQLHGSERSSPQVTLGARPAQPPGG